MVFKNTLHLTSMSLSIPSAAILNRRNTLSWYDIILRDAKCVILDRRLEIRGYEIAIAPLLLKHQSKFMNLTQVAYHIFYQAILRIMPNPADSTKKQCWAPAILNCTDRVTCGSVRVHARLIIIGSQV